MDQDLVSNRGFDAELFCPSKQARLPHGSLFVFHIWTHFADLDAIHVVFFALKPHAGLGSLASLRFGTTFLCSFGKDWALPWSCKMSHKTWWRLSIASKKALEMMVQQCSTRHFTAVAVLPCSASLGQVGDKANQELRLLDEYSAGEPDPLETSHYNQRWGFGIAYFQTKHDKTILYIIQTMVFLGNHLSFKP